jgi:restriction system protein
MGRRSSVFEDLMELSARLPWGVALGLALVSYGGLHWVAGRFALPVAPRAVADLGAAYIHSLIPALATLFQFILPLAWVAGAIVSLIRRSRGAVLFDRTIAGGRSAVDRLTWSDFERVIGEAFRRDGYAVQGNVERGPDGGVDLVLQKGSMHFLVQCKHWRTASIGVAVIRELYGVMTARGVDGAFVVTSGSFTPDAWGFAAQSGIDLIDGTRLEGWISRAEPPPKRSYAPELAAPVAPAVASIGTLAPACPRCSVGMVLRTARRGASAGQDFWGCLRYPRCRGTMPV